MKKVKKTALISILFTTFASMFLMISGCGKKYQEIALYKYIENTDGTLTITALEDGILVDVFNPMRKDFLK